MKPSLLISLALAMLACDAASDSPSGTNAADPAGTRSAMMKTVVAVLALTPDSPTRPSPTPHPTYTPVVPLTEADLLTPVWTKVDADYISPQAAIGNQVIVDVDTGDFFGLAPAPLTPEEGRLSIVAWMPDGRLVIASTRQRATQTLRRLFIGRPFASFELLPVQDHSILKFYASPAGDLAALQLTSDPVKVAIVETETWTTVYEVHGVNLPTQPWSSDGAYLALTVSGRAPLPGHLDIVKLADGSTRTLEAASFAWSNHGHRIAYATGLSTSPESRPLRVKDLDTGDEQLLPVGYGGFGWSPTDRYLVFSRADESLSSFEIVDLDADSAPVVIHGASFRGWLDDDTLFFAANVCDTFDLATIDADGTNYTLLTNAGRYTYAGLTASFSPDRSRYVYQVGQLFTRSFPKGPSREINVLPFELNRFVESWSADGQFVFLTVLGGRDGPCFPVPTPQITTIEKP